MRIYADGSGNIVQTLPTWQKEQAQDLGLPTAPTKPANVIYTLQLDETTNVGLAATVIAPPSGTTFSMPGGTLTQTAGGVSGAAVIAPDAGNYYMFRNGQALEQSLAGGVPLTPEQEGLLLQAFRQLAGMLPV
jgi:hypothetical protein